MNNAHAPHPGRRARPSPLPAWAQSAQWFGLSLLLVAIGLGVFTPLASESTGAWLIGAFVLFGLLTLLFERLILALHR
ncbi:hypothetical protein [Metapseudomonas furukawaii]|jgi:hypothetical protein|uniref:Uncharacterized protein n=1 Tax=Metapseudomonas furukawaii TaxID=1149133 RepID=A0AAD1BYR5_METFU|nr:MULTISPECIES: hypothetical protein [Pseudomonas]ELS27417.1 hypothetical protein ppKF707_4951 [Pseudomonas furukawaii]OWJ95176.1 hypothetical protein B6S59_11620 [Pseudomonas sp. A46]WAG81345.1 hypothetical protein LMK08_12010 [Pseudomonas furukawaii]BAU74146.1 hypothetical protein KF707C_24580 [Pseudomonas furukawaii]